MTSFRKWMSITLALLAMVCAASAKANESYPTRPVRLIVPFPAGGVGGIVARVPPKDVVDRLNNAFNTAVNDPAVLERLNKVQFVVNVRNQADFGTFMQEEATHARRIIEENQIKLD